MRRSLDLGSIWRVMRQTDLDAIRREAAASFQLLIVADTPGDAEALARYLSPDDDAIHPWLVLAATPGFGELQTLGSLNWALLLTQAEELSPALAATRQALVMRSVPVITVVIGQPGRVGLVPRRGETARVGVASLDAGAVAAVAVALFESVEPGMRLALGRQLPGLRPMLFDLLIDETAKANASYALSAGIAEIIPVLNIPLNVGDTLILTKNQLIMSYKIALVAGKEGSPRELIGEIIGVLGGGFLLRQVARQLVGLIPVAGIVPKVAVAYAGTWSVGRAIVLWATAGQAITPELLSDSATEALARGRAVAEALVAQAEQQRGAWWAWLQRWRARGRAPTLPSPTSEAAPLVPAAQHAGWRGWLRRLWPFGRR